MCVTGQCLCTMLAKHGDYRSWLQSPCVAPSLAGARSRVHHAQRTLTLVANDPTCIVPSPRAAVTCALGGARGSSGCREGGADCVSCFGRRRRPLAGRVGGSHALLWDLDEAFLRAARTCVHSCTAAITALHLRCSDQSSTHRVHRSVAKQQRRYAGSALTCAPRRSMKPLTSHSHTATRSGQQPGRSGAGRSSDTTPQHTHNLPSFRPDPAPTLRRMSVRPCIPASSSRVVRARHAKIRSCAQQLSPVFEAFQERARRVEEATTTTRRPRRRRPASETRGGTASQCRR